MKISEVIKKLDITFCIKGEREIETLGLATSDINVPFCTFLDSEEFLYSLNENVRMVIVNEKIAEKISSLENYGICVVDNSRNTFFKLHNALETDERYKRPEFDTKIGKNCNIHPRSSISEKNVIVGDNVTIEEFVVIRENTVIGDNCTIRAGAKIGGTDFEFKREGDEIFGVKHMGGVIVGNNVEIQYNTGINKALYPWDNTVVGDYTKVDMLVHIAHGVKIGKACMIVANSGIGGRVRIGDECWIGFGSTIKNGIEIGSNSRVNMGAVVTKSVKEGESVSGNFAIDHEKFISNIKKSLV